MGGEVHKSSIPIQVNRNGIDDEKCNDNCQLKEIYRVGIFSNEHKNEIIKQLTDWIKTNNDESKRH